MKGTTSRGTTRMTKKTLKLTEDEFECLQAVVVDTIEFLESEGDDPSKGSLLHMNEISNKLNREGGYEND